MTKGERSFRSQWINLADIKVYIPFNYIGQGCEVSGVLLLFYWALRLPALGQQLATNLQQYPMQRNRFLRLSELLNAPEEARGVDSKLPLKTASGESAANGGVAIEMRDLEHSGRRAHHTAGHQPGHRPG